MTTTTVHHLIIDIFVCNIKNWELWTEDFCKWICIWCNSNVAHHTCHGTNKYDIPTYFINRRHRRHRLPLQYQHSVFNDSSLQGIDFNEVKTSRYTVSVQIVCMVFFFYFKWFYDLKQKPAKQKTIIYLKSYIWNVRVWLYVIAETDV